MLNRFVLGMRVVVAWGVLLLNVPMVPAQEFGVIEDVYVGRHTISPFGGLGRYQNLLKYSEAFEDATSGATWAETNLTVSADSTAAPDGQTTADTFTVATASPGSTSQTVTTTVTLPYTLSVWAKAGTATNLTLELTTNGTGATTTTDSFTLTSDWERYNIAKSTGAGTSPTTVTATIKTTGAVGQTIIVWGAQLEQIPSGAETDAGVYVKTVASAVSTTSRGVVSNADLLVAGTQVTTSGLLDATKLTGTVPSGSLGNAVLKIGDTMTGTLTMGNATSNLITFGTPGVAAPSESSAGFKIKLWDGAGADDSYGLGINAGTLWQMVGVYGSFTWDINTGASATNWMKLNSTGLDVNSVAALGNNASLYGGAIANVKHDFVGQDCKNFTNTCTGVLSVPTVTDDQNETGDHSSAFWGRVNVDDSTGGTITLKDASVFRAYDAAEGTADVLTNNYGLYVHDMTVGTNDYGIAIEGADTQALWVSSGADNTDAANGIAFGSSRDTNLYRSAANTLKTNDSLAVGGNLIFSNAQKILGGTATTADLTLQTTSGVGAAGADMHFLVGNNGATEALTILNSGNVGIGSTAPFGTLELLTRQGGMGGSAVASLTQQLVLGGPYNLGPNSSGVKVWIGDYDNDGATVYPIYAEDENNFVDFWVKNSATQGGSPTMYFRGNVGIGATTPIAALHTVGAAASSGTGTISSSGTTVTGSSTAFTTQLNVGDALIASAQTKIVTAIASATSLTVNSAFSSDLAAGTTFTFQQPVTRLADSAGTTQLMLNSKGDVGISTRAPESPMDIVRGTAQTDWSSGTIPYGTEAADLILTRRHSATKDASLGYAASLIDFRATNAFLDEWSLAQIVASADPQGGSGYLGGLSFLTSAGGTTNPVGRRTQGAAPAVRMTIGATGNVGIGDTTPAALLTVGSGDKFQVDGSGNVTLASGAQITAGTLGSASATNLSLLGGTAAQIQTVQIGAGSGGSATPDFLGLDVKSDTGDPAGGFEGAMYYNTFDNKFRCYQNAAWTDCIAAGSNPAFSAITGGTNTSATMTIGTGATLTSSGGGDIAPLDVNFHLKDNGDTTKSVYFQVSGLMTGTDRTLTVPDASGTIALTSDLHSAVTLGTNTANALSLSGQQLSLGDVFVQLAGDTMSGGLIFSNVATELTTAGNEDLTLDAAGTGKTLIADDAVLTGHLGLGNTALATGSALIAAETQSVTATTHYLQSNPTFDVSSGTNLAINSVYGANTLNVTGTGSVANFRSFNAPVKVGASNTNTITNQTAYEASLQSVAGSAGTLTNSHGFWVSSNTASFSATGVKPVKWYGVRVEPPSGLGGTDASGSTNYGLYVGDLALPASGNAYALYQASTDDVNILAGSTRIGGTTAPTNALSVTGSANISSDLTVAGTITAGSGPNTITTAAGLLDATKLTGAVPAGSLPAGGYDSTYVNVGGDTMTGTLTIQNANAAAPPNQLKVQSTSTGGVGIQFQNSNAATNLWQVFISSDATPVFKIGRDNLADYLTISSNGLDVNGLAAFGDAGAISSTTLIDVDHNTVGMQVGMNLDPSLGSGSTAAFDQLYGLQIVPDDSVDTNGLILYGIRTTPVHNAVGSTASALIGLTSGWTTATGAGAVTEAVNVNVAAPTVNVAPTTTSGVKIDDQGAAGITNTYGLYLSPQTGSTNKYGLCFDCDGTWSTSTVASGIQFGTDANGVTLYRSAADTLKTDDSLVVGGTITIGTDTNLYRGTFDTLKTDDSLIVDGTLTMGTLRSPSGTTAARPSTCSIGDTYWATDGDTDGTLFVCRAANTWKDVDDDGAAGTVTSVGLAAPTAEFDVTNSPVTGSGTLTLAWDAQTTNKVFAAPNGSTGAPSFRALVANDLPAGGYDSTYVNVGGDTMSGALLLPDGTVGLPSLSFSGDTNTGIFRSGTDQMTLVANGQHTLTVADRKVGIGPSVPTARLEIDAADRTGVTAEDVHFLSDAQTLTLADGTPAIPAQRQNQFIAPTLNGVAGGGTETITDAATVYIDNAPSGSNITITNPYALWVDAGATKLDGALDVDGLSALGNNIAANVLYAVAVGHTFTNEPCEAFGIGCVGIQSVPKLTATQNQAQDSVVAFWGRVDVDDGTTSAITLTTAYGALIQNPLLGGGGTPDIITNNYGLYVNDMTAGSTKNVELGFGGTTPVIQMANGGTLTLNDGTNTLMTLADAGTTGNLSASGRILAAAHGNNQGLRLPTDGGAGAPAIATGQQAGDIVVDTNDSKLYVTYDGSAWTQVGGGGSGTVTSVSVTTANGVSGSVATATTTPAISLTLGAITPSSVAATGAVTGSNLSGTNTGDQTTITGNAGTATALQTARTINGVSFDGTANITVADSTKVAKVGDTGLGDLAFATGKALQTATTAGNTLLLQAYDTDTGPGYVTLATLTAGTAPSLDLAAGTTLGGAAISTGAHTNAFLTYRMLGVSIPVTNVDGGMVVPYAGTIVSVSLYREVAGASGSTIADVHKNGTTIFTTQANRPTLAFNSAGKKVTVTNMDVTAVAAGDILTCDVDQVDGGNPEDLVVIVELRKN